MKNIILIIALIFSYACSKSDDAPPPKELPKQLGKEFKIAGIGTMMYMLACKKDFKEFTHVTRYHTGSEDYPRVGDTVYMVYTDYAQHIYNSAPEIWRKCENHGMIRIDINGIVLETDTCD